MNTPAHGTGPVGHDFAQAPGRGPDYGRYETRPGGVHVLGYERSFEHPVERVWAAVTDPELMGDWLAEAEVDLQEGGTVELRWLDTDSEGRHTVATGRITALVPQRLVEYTVSVHGVLRFELRPEDGGTRLNFTCEMPGSDSYLRERLAGWHMHLDLLADALGGGTARRAHWFPQRLQKLFEVYGAAGPAFEHPRDRRDR